MSESNEMPIENMTPEQAAQQIDAVFEEVRKDPGHPYADGNNPLHRKVTERMTKLFEVKNKDGLLPVERAWQADLAQMVERQNKLVAEGQKEAELLEGLGFKPTEIPDDLQQYQLDGLRMQRLHAEKNYSALTPLIEKQLQTLKVPADIQGLFAGLNQSSNLDEQLKQDIIEKVIYWIHGANEQKYGRKKSED